MAKKYRTSSKSILFPDGRLHHSLVGVRHNKKSTEHFENENEKPELSIPGWQFVSNSKHPFWIRILWGILILAGTGVCLAHFICQLEFFLSEPTMISMNIMQTAAIKLPNIVLCPASLLEAESSRLPFFNSSKFENISTKDGESHLDAMWRRIRLPKEEMVLPSCAMSKFVVGKIHASCHDIAFEVEEIFTAYGTCYKYHFNDSLQYIGVYTLLFIQIPILKENFHPTDLEHHFELFYMIYDSNTQLAPYTITKNLRPVFRNTRLMSVIQSKEFTYLNKRNKKCEKDTTVVADCVQSCIEKILEKATTCKLPFMNSAKPDCRGNQIMETAAPLIPMLVEKEAVQCEIQCIRPCTDVIYNIRDEYFPSMNVNYIDLVFRFEDNSREIIEEVLSYDALQFISDIGGVFGLFIGVCILSLLESFHIMVLYMIQKFSKK